MAESDAFAKTTLLFDLLGEENSRSPMWSAYCIARGCRSYVSWWWLSARNVSSVKPLTYIMKRPEATQHNITSARRERESASERVRGNHALLPLFSLLLTTAAPFIDYSVYTLLLTNNTCSNVRTVSRLHLNHVGFSKVRCVYFHYLLPLWSTAKPNTHKQFSTFNFQLSQTQKLRHDDIFWSYPPIIKIIITKL